MTHPITNHQIFIGPAHEQMAKIKSGGVNLVVTSPPYPMIEMWDEIMASQNDSIAKSQTDGDGSKSFELMHQELDKIWEQVARVLLPGGFACINIGDATRSINENFALYNNHSRIISAFIKLGLNNMPNIIWRKQTNAPNKFMGSGMLPAGAYVTLEHEWILVFRKGGKRVFKTEIDKQLRRESAFFWEERNTWFSDLWDLKGVKQKMDVLDTRARSAAYPFEIPYRLINMYSVKGDMVLDPFLGTGTTSLAAMASERNSIGIEIDNSFLAIVEDNIERSAPEQLNRCIINRIDRHKNFLLIRSLEEDRNELKHFNEGLNLPVITSQETGMKFRFIDHISGNVTSGFTVYYKENVKSDDIVIRKSSKHGKQELLNFNL
jgi:DNA modification methylase